MRSIGAIALAVLLVPAVSHGDTITLPGIGNSAAAAGTPVFDIRVFTGTAELSSVPYFTRVSLTGDSLASHSARFGGGSGARGGSFANGFGIQAIRARGWSVSAFENLGGGGLSRVNRPFFVDVRRGTLRLDVRRPSVDRRGGNGGSRTGGSGGGNGGGGDVAAPPAVVVPDAVGVPFVPDSPVLIDTGGVVVSPGSLSPAAQDDPAPVPEPTTMLMVGAGIAALVRRRMSQRAAHS